MSRRQSRGPMFRNRIVGHGHEAPDQLLANPMNWRTHPDEQWNEVEKVLETVGWVQEVVVNRRTGHLVDGHLRVMLAMHRDEEQIPVKYIDVSPEEERLILTVLDPLAAMAGTDREKLGALTADVAAMPAFADSEIDLGAILTKERTRTKGLAHEVKACTCCEKKCRKGCGCFREH